MTVFVADNCAIAVEITVESAAHVAAREALLDRQMGPKRRLKSSEKLRRGRLPADGLALSAVDGEGNLVGTVRLWNVAAGVGADGKAVAAVLLGPNLINIGWEFFCRLGGPCSGA